MVVPRKYARSKGSAGIGNQGVNRLLSPILEGMDLVINGNTMPLRDYRHRWQAYLTVHILASQVGFVVKVLKSFWYLEGAGHAQLRIEGHIWISWYINQEKAIDWPMALSWL